MKEEKIKKILASIKNAVITADTNELFKLYQNAKQKINDDELADLAEISYNIINQYDMFLAFLCGLKDGKNHSVKIYDVLNGNLEEAVNITENFKIPQYRCAKQLLKKLNILSQDNITLENALEYSSYINYEYIKASYTYAVLLWQHCGTNKSKNSPTDKTICLGQKIKYCRKQAHLTQKKIGLVMGIDRTSLSKYENSVCSPKLEFIVEFSRLFRINPNDLINENLPLSKFKKKYPLQQFNLT